ncbi:MAG: 2OG-Fe(II) oxygenase family protein [Caulobacterales bacterium]|nr:2OG-Fe(II) oxygenase family protein [Caulobacterales bacterium]
MADVTPHLQAHYRALKSRLLARAAPAGERDQDLRDFVSAADQLRRAGRADWALELLEPLQPAGRADPAFNAALALASYALQDLETARDASARAADLAPAHADFAFMRAQFAFESWRPAAALFRRARRLAPTNLDVLKNMALALSAEGKHAKAVALLDEALAEHPGWVEGHRQLTSLRVTAGEAVVDESFAAACEREPANLALRLGWFHFLAQAKDWPRAGEVLAAARAVFAEPPALRMAELFLRAETGGRLCEDELFGPLADKADPGFDLCRVRYLLRTEEPERAEEIASAHLTTPQARLFWPYVSLCWRLTGDERFEWLERGGAFVATVDLDLSEDELAVLAATLMELHVMRSAYVEQSVRGGTQTGRNLFFNPDPAVQNVRRLVTRAVEDYRDALSTEDRHPLLSAPPARIAYSGSWSVLLARQGFHAAHTHILGWLSSAFYVALPEDMGAAPAGHLSIGRAPPELELDCEPYVQIAPKPGRLVMFPSTTWHGTEPFSGGERLTIAFDVAA